MLYKSHFCTFFHMIKLQLKIKRSIWWRIVDGSDLDVTREYLSEEECLELQEVLANALELGTTINDWTILKPQAEKCLQDLSKVNGYNFMEVVIYFICNYVNLIAYSELS